MRRLSIVSLTAVLLLTAACGVSDDPLDGETDSLAAELTLSDEQTQRYEEKVLAELGEECAHWLATGELPD